MSVTQTWNMLLIPDAFHETISKEYADALRVAEEYRLDNLSAIEMWKRHPESFGCFMLACDIDDRHLYYNSGVDHEVSQAYFGLFNHSAFDTLFYKFAKLCAPKEKCGMFEVAEVVVTHGNTAPEVLYQAIGRKAIDKLPGFFGNFYIKSSDIVKELAEYQNLVSQEDWNVLLQRGVNFYNAPCNDVENISIVEKIFQSLPNALQYAQKNKCGLLGLVVTAG